MRTSLFSITCLRKPAKLPGPALPVSIAAGLAAEVLGVDAERGAAPVDVGVEIDQPRRHDRAGEVADLSAGVGGEIGRDPGDLAAGERDVGHGIELLRGIDDTRPSQDEVIGHRDSLLACRRHATRWQRAARL
jgi:hypothetical protein